MRKRVAALLHAHESAAPEFLRAPLVQLPPEPEPGDRIGPYLLEEPLGEGGFAVVWRASRTDGVGRGVALKILKPGMDSAAVLARFEAERAALGRLDHPAIASIHEAGTTDQGRPYFAMERVDGPPITRFADRERLSLPARLELFVRACRAVQHAHSKGLVHRDLKPGNVLVELHDGRGEPKIIDFGVAKALEGKLVERLEITAHGELVGTPAYMAPEQAAGEADVDIRADVYSLGALLHELLVGSPPHALEQFRSASRASIERTLAEVEPASPSRAASEFGPEEVAIVAGARGMNVGELTATLRGDLDWIVGRALEKDPARRYSTVEALARDVERHLADEPVEAGPPSAGYRIGKFIRRNRGMVAAGSLGAIALLIGLGLAVVGLQRARNEARRSARIVEFQETIFITGDRLPTPEELIEEGLELFPDDRGMVLALLREVAVRQAGGPEPEAAIRYLREALARVPGETAQRAAIHGTLGDLLVRLDRAEEGRSELESCVQLAAPLSERLPLAVAEAHATLADLEAAEGHTARAAELYGEALEQLESSLPSARRTRVRWLLLQADTLANAERAEDAVAARLEALEGTLGSLPPGSPAAAQAQLSAVEWLEVWGPPETARAAVARAIQLAKPHVDEQPRLLFTAYGLAQRLEVDHDPTRADGFLALQVEVGRGWLEQDSLLWVQLLTDYADSLERRGRDAESLQARAEALSGLQQAGSSGEQYTGLTDRLLASVRSMAVDRGRTETFYQTARAAVEVILRTSPDNVDALLSQAQILQELGEYEQGREPLERAQRQLASGVDPGAATVHALLARQYWDIGKWEEARFSLARAEAYLEQKGGDFYARKCVEEARELIVP